MYYSQENKLQECTLPVGVTLLADSCLDCHLLIFGFMFMYTYRELDFLFSVASLLPVA